MKTLISKLKQLPRQGRVVNPNTQFITNPDGTIVVDPASPSQVSTDTYTVFAPDDVVTNSKQTVTAGLWSGNVGSLTTFFTASAQTTSQRRYYVDIYDDTPSSDGSAVQFAAAYGHALGSGSSDLGTEENPASKAVYAQYKNLLLEKGSSRFVTAGSGSTDSIYVINVKRNRVKERLDEGNFELPLTGIDVRDTNATGSVTVTADSGSITLIDDSSIASATVGVSGRVYNIVSGSISAGVYNSSAPVYYGLFYPDYGVMVLDGKMLDQQLNFNTNTTSDSEGSNHFALFHSISGSATGFQARNSQEITSANYFVRVKNGQYNFSNNPSYTTGSDGLLAQSTFIGDPQSYITTVGLYNEKNELLAVAKMSKPLLKNFAREQLIRVKLDY
ncbi:MAG: hypothetical protein ACYTA3_03410 [Planctomycetota bacterium]|jgi:hypothetical protein